MKIKPKQMMDSILNSIRAGKTFQEWMKKAPQEFAVLNGKRYTDKDIRENFDSLPEVAMNSIRQLWNLNSVPVKGKDEFRGAKCGGSRTIRIQKFVPKPGVRIVFSGVSAQHKSERRGKR